MTATAAPMSPRSAKIDWKIFPGMKRRKELLRMDKEVTDCSNNTVDVASSNCRREFQNPQRDVLGSTTVVAVVTPDKIVLSNCGDSRAIFCRNGITIPLSSDHKTNSIELKKQTGESYTRTGQEYSES